MNFHDIKWPYFDIRKARNHESGHGSDAPKIEGQNALPYCSKAYLVTWGWCGHPGHAYRQVMHLRRARTKQIQSWFLTEPYIQTGYAFTQLCNQTGFTARTYIITGAGSRQKLHLFKNVKDEGGLTNTCQVPKWM